ncbi:hypothetical protein ACFS3C_04045 [Azotobacter vinelandii]
METTILGVALHLIGGFASGSFYIPYKKRFAAGPGKVTGSREAWCPG